MNLSPRSLDLHAVDSLRPNEWLRATYLNIVDPQGALVALREDTAEDVELLIKVIQAVLLQVDRRPATA